MTCIICERRLQWQAQEFGDNNITGCCGHRTNGSGVYASIIMSIVKRVKLIS